MFFWEFGDPCDGKSIYRHAKRDFLSVPTGSPPDCLWPATYPVSLRCYTGRLLTYLCVPPGLMDDLCH